MSPDSVEFILLGLFLDLTALSEWILQAWEILFAHNQDR